MKSKIRLAMIGADDRAQPRAAVSADRVAEYVEDMGRGDNFPPLIVFRDKAGAYWLADGFHRYHAAIGLEWKTIECDVRKGELRDAILFSCGTNAAHGMRRTNDDKRQAVSKLLMDEEWSKWTDSEIARRCRVHQTFVSKMHASLKPVLSEPPAERTYRNKHGGTGTMRTGNIGRRAEAEPKAEPLPAQMAKDIENGWISAALWEIERQIDKLPAPVEAAEKFPTHHRHTFTAEKLAAMGEWLTHFAKSWKRRESEHGKARTEAA